MAEPVAHAHTCVATFHKAMWRNPDLEGLLAIHGEGLVLAMLTCECKPELNMQAQPEATSHILDIMVCKHVQSTLRRISC